MSRFTGHSLLVVACSSAVGLGSARTAPAQTRVTESSTELRATGESKTGAGKADKPRKDPKIDPQAMAALTRMGVFLRQQNHFAVRTSTQTDEVLESGQKIQLTSNNLIEVRRPDHLRVDVKSDRKVREFYYDGKSFVMNAPRMDYYAVVEAPPSIGELITVVQDDYGIELPLVDLFLWGTDKAATDAITSAIRIGPSTIDGVETDQFAFRQPGLDWQIWIEPGQRPLPRKLVLTTTDEPSRPQHVIVMEWDLAHNADDARFQFTPSKTSHRIPLNEVKKARQKAKRDRG